MEKARIGSGEFIMAIEKVGVYRKYHGSVPRNKTDQPMPKSEWQDKRPFSWAVRWFGSDGKRYSKSFKTRKEAERFAEAKQSEVRVGKADPPCRILLREYYDEHKEFMRGNLAHKTLHMQLATFTLLAESVGWERDLARIGTRDIERFRARRLAMGIAAASANRELRTLKRLFSLAAIRGYIPASGNPCFGVPMLKIGRKRPAYCNPMEFTGIFRAAPDSLWRALLVVLYTTGVRLREALNLTWSDIDFGAGQLHVTRKVAVGFVQAWTPKDHEMRTIPLSQPAIDALTAWQSIAPESCPYVFMESGRWQYYRQQVTDGRWSASADLVNNVLRRFKTLCRRAAVGPYTVHDLRRSCVTNWARRLPIHVVQQLAGHSDINTTQQFYLSVRPEDVAEARAVAGSLLARLPKSEVTDPKLTHSGQKRAFPGRQALSSVTQTTGN
jgi:integrase